MEIEEENACNLGMKTNKPLVLDWKQLLPTASPDDDRPPERVVKSDKKSKDAATGGDAQQDQMEHLELPSKPDHEINEYIARLKKIIPSLGAKLPDKGEKLKAVFRRHVEELERRKKLRSEKVHKEAAKWKNKTFPHFEDLCIVFGKDRANGNRLRDAMEMEDASMEDHKNQFPNDQDDASNAHTNVKSQEYSSGSNNKRKNRSESLHDCVNNATFVLGDKLTKALETMMQVEVQMLKKREMIADELEKYGTFSETEMFTALQKITKDSESVITFWSLKEARRENWVRFMLNQ